MARKKSAKGPAGVVPAKTEVMTTELEPSPPAPPLRNPPPSTTNTAVEPEAVKLVEPEAVKPVEPEAVKSVEPEAVEPEAVEAVEQAASNETAVVNTEESGEELGENLPLFPVPIKGPAGEEIELQVGGG